MPPDSPLRFDHFELHPAERVLRVRGEPVSVGSRAFDVLLVLAQRHERLVTKQELLDLVWPGLVVEEHNIATQISTLRKLLGAGAIATLPGYGYRLTAQTVAAGAAAPSAAATGPTARHNLPDPRTRFIGREAALAELERLLPAARLLTLTGIGGCGKTRLAVQFARRQVAAFADGVWFVDLAPLKEAERVASSCAAVLGLGEEGSTPLIERLVRQLAARRTLLVLDNCEHVIDGVTALVEALLAGTGDTTVIATSREGLGVPGEQIYPVRSLSLPASAELGAVRGAESVRVFVDRARLALPDFEVDADNAAPLAEICRRLDGIALAIELAAARVPMLPLAEVAARLDDRFRLLTGGSRALPRHQTLHAAMQWSYELLATAEQRMLRQMSVFAGGWTLQAAAEVAQAADEYEALALLTALHDKSLIVVDRADVGERPRYRMLETVRQYALERLNECGESGGARARHVAHFIAMAEEAEAHVRGPDQDVWMSRFKQEHENLVAALSWCCAGPVEPSSGLRLAAATGYYWGWNSVELGDRLTRAVLERDHAAAPTPEREGALRALARISEFRGRHEEALAFAQQALAVARQLGAPRRIAWALNAVGSALASLGHTAPALRAEEEALELARRLDDGVLLFTLLNNVGTCRHRAGQLDAAERCCLEALGLARRHVGRVGHVVVLDNLIRVLVARGELDRARQFARQCLPLARREKVSVDLLEATVGLASRRGEHALAARFWGAADRQLLAWGYRHEPGELEHLEPLLANSRRELGDAAFEAAEAAGRAMPFEQALTELEAWLGVER
ncbi:MAG TPA: tetratricopeptide repeat protein [Burkholderiaceae bacterium]|nr:tetratricopeptide repeat protein [Burkholderiaceae bacterium]